MSRTAESPKIQISTYQVNRFRKMVLEHHSERMREWFENGWPGGVELYERILSGEATNKEIRAALIVDKMLQATKPKKTLKDFLS